MNVILVGDSGVGKTSLINRYAHNKFDTARTVTLEAEVETMERKLPSGTLATILMYDTRGQEQFRQITSGFYRDANVVGLVFDLADESSFESIPNWLSQVESSAFDTTFNLVIGTKSDLDQEVAESRIQQFCENVRLPYCIVSSKEGESVEEHFNKLFDEAVLKGFMNVLEDSSAGNVEEVEGVRKGAKGGGCCIVQ